MEANLSDEADGDHPGLWLRFAASVGASSEACRETAPEAETTGCVRAFRDGAGSASLPFALGMIYGYESQTTRVAETKVSRLRDRSWRRSGGQRGARPPHELGDLVKLDLAVAGLAEHTVEDDKVVVEVRVADGLRPLRLDRRTGHGFRVTASDWRAGTMRQQVVREVGGDLGRRVGVGRHGRLD